MTPAIIADSIVNICGALGLCVAIAVLHRRDRKGRTTFLINLALGAVAALFFLRGIAWWTGSVAFDQASIAFAALFPLAVLLAAEIVMRRHAPRALKIYTVVGAALLMLGVATGIARDNAAYYIALPAFQFSVVAACGVLLYRRGAGDLTAQESRIVKRVGLAVLIAAPFLLTDFRSLFADPPVRVGPLGVLIGVSLLLAEGGSEARLRSFALLSMRLAAALLLGLAAGWMTPGSQMGDLLRHAAVAGAGVLAIGLTVDAAREILAARAEGLLAAVAVSPARTRDALVATLTSHPLFGDARRCRESDLVDFDPHILRNLLPEAMVLRRNDAPWRRSDTDAGVERLTSLFATFEATHVIVLERAPLDLLVVSVPVVAADATTETALQLLGRILANAPEETACSTS